MILMIYYTSLLVIVVTVAANENELYSNVYSFFCALVFLDIIVGALARVMLYVQAYFISFWIIKKTTRT